MLSGGFRISISAGTLLLAATFVVSAQQEKDLATRKLAPYVTSPQPIAERMLEIARLKPGETVFDLGCGDGRILMAAAKKFGAKAVGIELNDQLAKRASAQARSEGLDDQIKVIQGDMLSVDVSAANVVSLYLMTEANEQLRPKLERELKAGSRVVSLDFKVEGWKPSQVEKLEAYHRHYTIYLYQLPQKR